MAQIHGNFVALDFQNRVKTTGTLWRKPIVKNKNPIDKPIVVPSSAAEISDKKQNGARPANAD